MYLTAHHVRARDGATGINAFLGSHAEPTPGIDWATPDISAIADARPGRAVLQSLEVKPGGNAVLSFLDVAAPDGTSPGFIADSLRLFEHYVAEGPLPARWSSRHVALRFGANLGLEPLRVAEFRRLRTRALMLLGVSDESKLRRAPTRLMAPLRITVDRDRDGASYQLDEPSAIRVLQVRPDLSATTRIRVSDDTHDAFRALVGELHPHIAMSLTGLTESQLARLGGVELADADVVVWRLPGTARGEGFFHALLPGQVLGVWIRAGSPLPDPHHAPTGSILPRVGGRLDVPVLSALDLVQVEDVWLPLSEAGLYTYSHSSGLQASEQWQFVTKPVQGLGPLVFDAMIHEDLLERDQVTALYGGPAAERVRPDRRTVQLRLRRRHP